MKTCSISEPVKDSVTYESALGNAAYAYAPYAHQSRLAYDAVGRPVLAASLYDDAGHERKDTSSFDALDRDVLHRTATISDTVILRRRFGPGGTLDTLTRQSGPDTNHVGAIASYFAYDARDNVIAFTDRNRLQTDGDTETVMPLEPLARSLQDQRMLVRPSSGVPTWNWKPPEPRSSNSNGLAAIRHRVHESAAALGRSRGGWGRQARTG